VAEWYGDAAEAADLATMCQQSQAVFLATTSSTPVVDVRLGGGIPFISSVGADADNLSELAPDLLPGRLLVSESAQNIVACLGNPDPGDMKVYCPTGKETFDDDETTEEAPS
jgi:ornithine cyclodeaminase/alanine dehydrogenase-like protein (mu-crystallin family)